MKIPLEYCFPTLATGLKAMKLDHVLEVHGCVKIALWIVVINSLTYGLIWFADLLQLECLHCIVYQPVGIVIFFVNAWIGGILLASYDETGSLRQQLEESADSLAKETDQLISDVRAQNRKLCEMLTQNVLHGLNQLIAQMRTILSECEDKGSRGQLIDCMADCLIKIRKSTVSHFKLKSEETRSHRFMRNLVGRDIIDSSQEYRMRDVLDVTREFISTRTATLLNTPSDNMTSPAEEALWPEGEMIEKLNGYRKGIQRSGANQDGSAANGPDGSLFSSPLCKSLLFGLLTSFLLIGFYLFTGAASLTRFMEEECDYNCQLHAVDDLIRKFIGICATSCQIGALIVIIYNLDKLDPILILKEQVREFEDVKQSVEKLDKVVESGAKEEIALEEVLQEINGFIVLTGAFVRDLANKKSLPLDAFKVLLQQLRGKISNKSGAAGKSPSSSQEGIPLLQAEAV